MYPKFILGKICIGWNKSYVRIFETAPPPHHKPAVRLGEILIDLLTPSLRNLWMSSPIVAIAMLDDLGLLSPDKQPTQRAKGTGRFYTQLRCIRFRLVL